MLRELAARRIAELSESAFLTREAGLPMLPLLGRLSAVLQSIRQGGDVVATALQVPGIVERLLSRVEKRWPWSEAWRALLGVG